MDYVSSRFGCAVVGNTVVGLHGEDNPDDADWNAYLDAGRRILQEHEQLRVLAFSLGGGPNSTQRSMVNDMFKDRPQQVAVMLDSRLARGAVTALSWFNPKIKAFNLEQLDEACSHLGLSAEQTQAVQASLESMRSRLLEQAKSGA